jgi:hypothetical protein
MQDSIKTGLELDVGLKKWIDSTDFGYGIVYSCQRQVP